MRRGNRLLKGVFWAVLCGTALAASAQVLPPTSPTGSQPASPSPSAADAAISSATATPAPVRPAQVSYQMGQLTVIAENSSLNAILREVATKTGMKVTGSIADQQVYGTYGPAAPVAVLARLLEGSGTNMILRESASSVPVELVLSPMQGMPNTFAPNPPAYTPPPQAYAAPAYQPPSYQAPSRPQYNMPQPAYVQSPVAPVTQPAGTSAPDASTTPSVPQSPNGVPTPQQIYEQLQRLQQQRAQPTATR